MLPVLAWWVVIQIFGLAALPLTARLLRWLPDRGYAFSKAIGLLLVAYLLWLGASAGVWVNSPAGITLAWLLLASTAAWLLLNRGWENAQLRARSFWRENKDQILIVEALFLIAFIGWAALRAYAPDKIIPAGGEKYMEIAFLNGVLNSPYFPPLDPWLAGYAISYYYFGYVMMGVMVQATGVPPTVGFDLYDALSFALSAACAYGVVANLVRAGHGTRRAAAAAGLLSALLVLGTGNQEGWIHALYSANRLPQNVLTWLSIPDLAKDPQSGTLTPPTWFWWRASRVLDDRDLFNQPLTNLQPITEFPFFSFLLGDNHPHKLALPFTLLAVGLAFNLLLRQRALSDPPDSALPGSWRNWARLRLSRRSDLGLYLFYAVVLGGLAFLNTWDFPIYLALCMLASAAGLMLRHGRFQAAVIRQTLASGAILGISAILLYLFFYLSFSSQAGGVLPYVFSPTRLAQYLIQFAPFIYILAFFLILAARGTSGQSRFPYGTVLRAWMWIAGLMYGIYLLVLVVGGAAMQFLFKQGELDFINRWLGGLSTGQALSRILLSRVTEPWLFLLLSGLLALAAAGVLRAVHHMPEGNAGYSAAGSAADSSAWSPATLFTLLVAFTGLAMTLFVEFFYLRDTFGVRLNTVFKFYFQGWVLMACASAYAVWWVFAKAGSWTRAAFAAGSVLLLAGGLVYPLLAIPNRAEGFHYPPNLDAAATVAGTIPDRWAAQPDDWAAIQWLRKTVPAGSGDVPVILEATEGGYNNAGRISAFTGFPTLLGWSGHEWQWRGSNREQNRREADIRTIYTTPTGSTALDLLHKWSIRYVILGESELRYIDEICTSKETPCNAKRAVSKFKQILRPVFTQGSITIFAVP